MYVGIEACVMVGLVGDSDGAASGDGGVIGIGVGDGIGAGEALYVGESNGAAMGDAAGIGAALDAVVPSLWTVVATIVGDCCGNVVLVVPSAATLLLASRSAANARARTMVEAAAVVASRLISL